jgi:aspartate racemase
MSKTVGVLGGMGPDATVDFMSLVIALTPAAKDQDHIHMLVDHNPVVPDRQSAMRGDRSIVSTVLTQMALRLEAAGADFLVMPCNTAHVFLDEVLTKIHVPFIHIVKETVGEISAQYPLARNIGVLATTACADTGIYQSAIETSGRSSVHPGAARQKEVMDLVFRIKRGDKGKDVRNAMHRIAAELVESGADAIVAGCTEIPLVLGDADIGVPYLSSTEVLARRTVAMAIE